LPELARFLDRRRALLVAALVLLAGAVAAAAAWRWYERPLPMDAQRVEVRIEPGASARRIARQLQEAGIVLNAEAFVAVARATKATQSLRAGRYAIERGTTLHQLIDKLKRGEVLRERLTVVEGWTFRQMRQFLREQRDLRQDSALMSDGELLAAVGAVEGHPEGLFAPDTYTFDPGSSDLELYRRAYREQQRRLQSAWDARDPSLPYAAPYEALIMASIVEKETGQGEERARIAGVFVNRLRRGMLLQTDPTVIYGLGDAFDGNLRRRDLLADGPYNSYTRPGLPPTPIALPGREAITAALNPEDTRALYFVARGDGTSHFSETLAEHNRAVEKYQLRGGR
jgi:UPF0755 protein